jgi:beta-lactam-binding protein with PASTA domain
MSFGGRVAAPGITALVIPCLLAACSNAPGAGQKKAERNTLSTTSSTTTTTTPPTATLPPTTTQPGVVVPNVIGLKITAARNALRAAGFPSVSLNAPCNLGTVASQSVAASLSIPGKPPDVRVGAVPLSAGTDAPPGTRIGINWSGCYGDAAEVPAVVGLTFPAAHQALHAAGLVWACYSVGEPPTTTTTHAPRTTTTSDATTTTAPETTTTVKVKAVQTVLTQSPAAHTVLHPGATVTLTMHRCPQ